MANKSTILISLLEILNINGKKKKRWFSINKIGVAISVLIGIIAGSITIIIFIENRSLVDVSGEWKLTDKIESANLIRYRGLKLGYRIFLTQKGNEIKGKGEKYLENDDKIPPSKRVIIVIEGKIDGDNLIANFTEYGKLRITTGIFKWKILSDKKKGRKLVGFFKHTAADASGSSLAEITK